MNIEEDAAGFLLPRGFPDTVTDDYIDYQIWALPSHIFGWMSHSLATSSLLKAVGVNGGAVGTAGATAAVKWITKDGIGALGRLLVRELYLLNSTVTKGAPPAAAQASVYHHRIGLASSTHLMLLHCPP